METATKADLIDLENRLVEQMRTIETTLLTEFRKWALPVSARLRTLETTHANLVERVGLLEDRMDELNRGRQPHSN